MNNQIKPLGSNTAGEEHIAEIQNRLLHHFGRPWRYLSTPALELVETDQINGLTREIYRIRLDQHYAAPVCVIVPPGDGPHPTVLTIHGGDGGLDVCCGDGIGRSGSGHYHHNMSLELTQAGFATITISIRGLGREAQNWRFGDCGRQMETRDDFVGYTIFRGSCPMNVWTSDARMILAAFENDSRFDSERTAVAGISTGGELALYLGALESRIKVICSHGALVSYEDLYTIAHNYAIHAIPDAIGKFDMGDIGMACCPRPLQIQVGEKEPEFWGRNRQSTFSEYARIEEFYKLNGFISELHVTPGGGHAFDSEAGIRFLREHL